MANHVPMSTHAIDLTNEDTMRVARQAAPRPRFVPAPPPPRRLADMDLDPPEGPVPADVLAYFEDAVDRERRRASRNGG